MTFPIRLTPFIRQQLYRRLRQAYASGSLRLVTRIHALLAIAEGMAVSEVAQMLTLGEQTVRDYLNRFLWRGVGSLAYQRPPGRHPGFIARYVSRTYAALPPRGRQKMPSEASEHYLRQVVGGLACPNI